MNWFALLSGERPAAMHSASQNLRRNAFEKDVDRIIFSHPFRKLQDKTQVVPLPEYDFVHTRLTHSLEVSSVGRSLGLRAGAFILEQEPELKENGYSDTDFAHIIQAACLAHDIGNPPFGHSGESGISSAFSMGKLKEYKDLFQPNAWYDLCNFEGNAQGFRILMQKGLQPTAAVLGAFVKYPCIGNLNDRNKSLKSQKKYNFFISEIEQAQVFLDLCQLNKVSESDFSYARHPLVFLTEAADDICYLVIDLEDAARMRIISEEKYMDLLAPICGEQLDLTRLQSYPDINQRLGLVRALAINRLVDDAIQVFCTHYPEIMQGLYQKSLMDDGIYAGTLDAISTFSQQYIYNSNKVVELQAAGFEILPRLTELFCEAMIASYQNRADAKQKNLMRLLPFQIAPEKGLYEHMRLCLDFISGLTDRHALQLHKKLWGIEI